MVRSWLRLRLTMYRGRRGLHTLPTGRTWRHQRAVPGSRGKCPLWRRRTSKRWDGLSTRRQTPIRTPRPPLSSNEEVTKPRIGARHQLGRARSQNRADAPAAHRTKVQLAPRTFVGQHDDVHTVAGDLRLTIN